MKRDSGDYLGYLIGIAVVCAVIGAVVTIVKHGELTSPCCETPVRLS